MKNLEAIRTAGQENLTRLVHLGKEQPSEVKTWGVTAGAAVAGGIVMVAGAQGLLAIFATLATLPVSLTVGAIGGGVLGWLYIDRQKAANKATAVAETRFSTPAPQAFAAEVAAPAVDSMAANSELPGVLDEADVVTSVSISPSQAEEPLLLTPEIVTESQPVATPVPAPIDTELVDTELVDTELVDTELVDTVPVENEIAVPPAQQDKLEDIVGIGPVFATRLHAVGIYTFAQLAALSPEQLLELMASSRGGHLIDAADWLKQASQLAASSAG